MKWSKWIPAVLGLTVFLSTAVSADAENKASEYLDVFYGITPFSTEEATIEEVNDALEKLGAETIDKDELEMGDVIRSGIRLAGLEELARLYTADLLPEEAGDVPEELKDKEEGAQAEYLPYYMCALDMDLIEDAEDVDIADFLYRCAELADKGRRYIGRADNDSTLTNFRSVLNSFSRFDAPELTAVGNNIVFSGATTGYNLKYSGYDAHFLPEYTLTYGHDDPVHAEQLIALLNVMDLDAYVMVEPKVSVYEYLPEWGDPGEATPTYEVKEEEDGRYMCYSVEFDLVLEFDSREDKEMFHEIIETYAKKYDDRVDEEGNVTVPLLEGSWWQPLYSSETEMDNKEFGELVNNRVYDKNGYYYINSFSVPEQAEAVAEKVHETAPELEVTPITIYVNPAFIRYITGEDHQ